MKKVIDISKKISRSEILNRYKKLGAEFVGNYIMHNSKHNIDVILPLYKIGDLVILGHEFSPGLTHNEIANHSIVKEISESSESSKTLINTAETMLTSGDDLNIASLIAAFAPQFMGGGTDNSLEFEFVVDDDENLESLLKMDIDPTPLVVKLPVFSKSAVTKLLSNPKVAMSVMGGASKTPAKTESTHRRL